jgi:hypothetical protein
MSTHARTTAFALALTAAATLASSAAQAFGGRLPNPCYFVKCEDRPRTLADYNIQKESSGPGLGLKGNGSSIGAMNRSMAMPRLDAPRLTMPGGSGGSAARIR